jgi:2-iminobutanoate/2-iminopropanoate deaminase
MQNLQRWDMVLGSGAAAGILPHSRGSNPFPGPTSRRPCHHRTQKSIHNLTPWEHLDSSITPNAAHPDRLTEVPPAQTGTSELRPMQDNEPGEYSVRERRRTSKSDQSSKGEMAPKVETSIPPNTPTPIGPYSHVAKVGQFVTIGGTAGMNPATGQLAGSDVASQTKQILTSFKVMLASVGSDLNHVVHINVFLKDMKDFERMNEAYAESMGEHRPARTVIGVRQLPKPGVLVTMNLTAVIKEGAK